MLGSSRRVRVAKYGRAKFILRTAVALECESELFAFVPPAYFSGHNSDLRCADSEVFRGSDVERRRRMKRCKLVATDELLIT